MFDPLDLIGLGGVLAIWSHFNKPKEIPYPCRSCHISVIWSDKQKQYVHLLPGMEVYADTPGIPGYRHPAIPKK